MSSVSYTESQLVNIKQQFNSMDQDGDGFITEKEFIAALKNANLDPDEYDSQQFFSDADKSKDGKITFSEFVSACHRLGLGTSAPASGRPGQKDDREIDSIFKTFDIDGNGTISAAELKRTLNRQGEYPTDAEIEEMITAADKNNDGLVDRSEFARMI
ncbi:hypothetical protein EMPS_03442 [Entomortierella parvispora]|uniref:EF-hand domain-containing protein n=1 Tax=Entomortierella parvispora TaxID=205924 RepID=A0A9P3LUL0_9FUNG|nr:hypothetical protein EMPS_03442 [Entomortierella parvispora]